MTHPARLAYQPTQTGLAYYTTERARLHQRLVEVSALIEYGLKEGLLHLYDCNGRFLPTLDQWLAAVQAGRWPGEGNGG